LDFALSQDQQELKDRAREFGESRLNEGLVERDRDGEFSRENWQACAEFGLQGIVVPERYGGMELKPCDIVAILEGAGQGCRDNGLLFSINAHLWACVVPILNFGNEAQKQEYLPKLCRGDWIGANAITEPDSGSNVYSLRTSARKEKDYYVLNGSKTFVTNAPVADVFVTYARTGQGKGFAGLSCFAIEKGTPGLTVGNAFEKMGLRTSPMAEVAFDDCKVPERSRIGREGAGSMIFADSMEWERLFILSSCLGAMDHRLATCIQYAKTRNPGGTPISKHPAVAERIVQMRVRLETARLLLYQAAWVKEKKRAAPMESAMAKLYVSDAYVQNARDMIQVYGGYGYMVEYGLERELRDAIASTIYSGTSEVQRNIVAGFMGL
jgi:hypothetical protein